MAPEIIAGRYRIEREVGRGGMGAVWLATDERLGRPVAIKQVGHLPGESVPDLARAMREARSSAALNHRNVVSVYDAIEEGDHIWLVMEYVPGSTLSQIVAANGPMEPERAAWIGAQVADGLAAAHELGTVHRDVKPGNVLIADDDSAKISDFGIARTLGEEKLTQSGLMTGTPAYFSPELARGADASPASDVWALGATLYAAVEGASPYPDQSNALALLASIADGPPPPPQRAGILTDAINRMMDPDVGSRWDMADASHALHRLHKVSVVGKLKDENTVAFAAPVAGAAAAAAAPLDDAVAPAVVDPTPTPTPAPTPPLPTPVPAGAASDSSGGGRGRGVLLLLGVLALLVLVGGTGYLLLGGGDGGDDDTQAEESTSDTSPSEDATEEPTAEEPSPETTEEPPTEEATSEEPAETEPPATSGDAETFVADYYSVLPSDTRAGWSMLSPDYQSQTTYGKYSGFWRTIDSVSVEDTRPGEDGSVDVDIVYTTDGSSEPETRRIYLEETEDGYLITGDEAI